MEFGLCHLAKLCQKAVLLLLLLLILVLTTSSNITVISSITMKPKDFRDAAIDSMGDFVDGEKIFGCPSRPPLADELRPSQLRET